MKPFEDTYGILALVAAQESNLKQDEDFDKDDFLGELEIVLQSVDSKVSADRNVLSDNTELYLLR